MSTHNQPRRLRIGSLDRDVDVLVLVSDPDQVIRVGHLLRRIESVSRQHDHHRTELADQVGVEAVARRNSHVECKAKSASTE